MAPAVHEERRRSAVHRGIPRPGSYGFQAVPLCPEQRREAVTCVLPELAPQHFVPTSEVW